MFIHFGLYSIPAGIWNGARMGRNDYAEWIEVQGNWPHGIPAAEYQGLAAQFNPVRFNADQWVAELTAAGMKYLVVTSKHHDGFALWPSNVSKFNVVDATPFGRDIIGELKDACDRQHIHFGLYYSHWLDWEHQFGGRPHADEGFSGSWAVQPTDEQFEIYWQEKCLPQVAELSDRYNPRLFWFDTWGPNSTPWITESRMDELIGLVKSKDSTCLINSRIGTWGHSKGNGAVDFLSMGDNCFPDHDLSIPWESSGTLNESWGYHQLDFRWKATKDLIGNLANAASHGGNYQLNVGPTGDGVFQPAAIRRLREIGAWMAANGTSIYRSECANLPEQSWGKVTKRTNDDGSWNLYLHLSAQTEGETIEVVGVTTLPKAATILETNEKLIAKQCEAQTNIFVTLPNHAVTYGAPTVIALEFPDHLNK